MSVLLRKPGSYNTMDLETQAVAVEERGFAVAISIPDEELQAIRGLLASEAIDVQATCSVREALSGSIDRTPAILLDADTDGSWREALEQCLHKWPQSRVVLISRLADEQMWVEALNAGAHDLLPKPLQPQETRSAVCSALSYWNERPCCPRR